MASHAVIRKMRMVAHYGRPASDKSQIENTTRISNRRHVASSQIRCPFASVGAGASRLRGAADVGGRRRSGMRLLGLHPYSLLYCVGPLGNKLEDLLINPPEGDRAGRGAGWRMRAVGWDGRKKADGSAGMRTKEPA